MSEIDVSSAQVFTKTLFSMAIPEVLDLMSGQPDRNSVVLFGIETQVRVSDSDLHTAALIESSFNTNSARVLLALLYSN